MPRTSNGAVELEYRRDGPADGRPLLLVNGLGSPLVAYQPGFVAALGSRGFQVGRFDNRDVGRSTRFQGVGLAYTIDDMAADALAVLDALGWDRAHVFGQSMGGMIVQQLAITAPGRVASMTSLMSGTGEPGFGRATPEAVEALVQPAPTDRAAWLEHRVRTERIWASPALWDETWARAKGEAMFDYGVDPKGAARQYRAIGAAPSRDPELARLDVPTLVIHGTADTLVDPDAGRHTAEVIPGARYVEVEGMGHDLPPGLWDRIAAEVAAFVP
jgi:pimeloyl-ACP methyl ester carboxylesterase